MPTFTGYGIYHYNDMLYFHTPIGLKARIKLIFGTVWDKSLKIWKAPCTPAVLQNIQQVLPESEYPTLYTPQLRNLFLSEQVSLMARFSTRLGKYSPIPLVKTTPRAYQQEAFWRALEEPGFMLDMDMGTGKTKVAIDLINNRQLTKVLVLCPKSAIDVWVSEFPKHSSVDYALFPLGGTATAKQKTGALKSILQSYAETQFPTVVILNYDIAWRTPLAEALIAAEFEMVVCDEIHRIKEPNGKISTFCGELAWKTPYRLGLTGTPTPHSPCDLYGSYRFLDAGLFGCSYTRFKERYCEEDYFGRVEGYKNVEEYREKYERISFHVKKRDVLDLPPVAQEHRLCDLPNWNDYETLRKEFVLEVKEGIVTAANALTRILRLQQFTSGYLIADGGEEIAFAENPKLDLLHDLVRDLPQDEPVVVFTRFGMTLRQLWEKIVIFTGDGV